MKLHPAASGSRTQIANRQLRLLMVEDNESDALIIQRELVKAGYRVTHERVDTPEAMDVALERQSWDLILADHSMPQFSAPEALELVKKRGLDIPFIIVSGFIEEETAVAAMQAGAHDYIMKDQLARLAPAVERELREAEVRRARNQFERELLKSQEELEERVAQRTADLQAAYLELSNLMAERRRLENELLEIAENERRRIGFDLHDDLGQKMTGLLLMVKALEQRLSRENSECCQDASQIACLVQEAMQHTHDIAKDFSAVGAQIGELSEMLEELTAKVQKTFQTSCQLKVFGSLPPVTRETVTQLHKIAQEAVSNAIKHGQATEVLIEINCDSGESLVLRIQNDGRPYASPKGAHGRLGLKIMKYRANMIGATLEIRARSRGGTVVTCTLPKPGGARPNRTAEIAGELHPQAI